MSVASRNYLVFCVLVFPDDALLGSVCGGGEGQFYIDYPDFTVDQLKAEYWILWPDFELIFGRVPQDLAHSSYSTKLLITVK